MLFWKDVWLETAPDAEDAGREEPRPTDDIPPVLEAATHDESHTDDDPVFACQATEMLRATQFVSARDLRIWANDVRSGNAGLWTALRSFAVLLFNKWQSLSMRLPRFLRIRGGASWPWFAPTGERRSYPPLDLKPGELVEVKSQGEIEATLNDKGEVRGLRFSAEMLPYCGTRARVIARVDRIIDEKTGRMLKLRDCIMLEQAWCQGTYRALCRRKIYTYWRESWLRRVDNGDS